MLQAKYVCCMRAVSISMFCIYVCMCTTLLNLLLLLLLHVVPPTMVKRWGNVLIRKIVWLRCVIATVKATR